MTELDAALLAGIGWTLRATVVLGAAWVLTALLRRASAAVRHTVWAAALAGTLLIPLVTSALPWRWEVAPRVLDQLGVTEVIEDVRPTGTEPAATVGPTHEAKGSADEASLLTEPAAANAVGPVRRGRDASATALASPRSRLAAWTLGLWAAGTLLVLAFLVRGGLTLTRLRSEGEPFHGPAERDWIEALAVRSGVAGRVEVLRSDGVTVPLTTGLLRPAVLLPANPEEEWSADRLEAVLLHEFAHVRRRDLLAHLVGRVVCAFHWFNPLSWLAAKRMSRESERACDDVVLRAGTQPSAYAEHLIEIVKAGRSEFRSAPVLSMAKRTDFEGRILALLDGETARGPTRTKVLAAVAATAVVLLVLVSLPASGGDGTAEPAPVLEDVRSSLREAGLEAGSAEGTIVETLMGLLDDDHPSVREAAARALGDLGTREAVPRLIEMLSDPDNEVREESAVALGMMRARSAVGPLAQVLVTDEDWDVREAAAWALGETESPEAVTRLADALESVRSSWLQSEIVEALGETRQPSAVRVLEGLLDGRDRRLQRRVLEALAEIGSDEALNVLVGAMQSEDPSLRRMAARALGERG